ncbi:hypothetical protein, partial [Nocardioides sp.]|uniref:hypothetical protein n=1 Tax=Nocardioides sp. TaxID=35761 RepID=UPI00273660AA
MRVLRPGIVVVALLATALSPVAASGTPQDQPRDHPQMWPGVESGLGVGSEADVGSGLAPGARPGQSRIHPTDPELTRLLARDRSAHLGPDEMVYYADPVPMDQPLTAEAAPAAAYPYADTFDLHSMPGAQRVIYLDFDGVTVQNTVWNTYFGLLNATYPGFDMDGSPGTFSQTERNVIQDVWRRVAEDFAPFAVNVTTADPGAAALNRSSSADQEYGVRVAITGSSLVASVLCGSSCTGIAFLDIFNKTGSAAYQPAWVFSAPVRNDPIQIAETASHEAGHTLGLRHDGSTHDSDNNGIAPDEYYLGHYYHSGPRPSRWSPIMGYGYGAITHWSKGEYAGATNTQDDLAVMHASGIPRRADDHGDTPTTATPLGSGSPVEGVIGTPADRDVFTIEHGCQGQLAVHAVPVGGGANLDIELTVSRDGAALATINPLSGSSSYFVATGLDASYVGDLPAGTYELTVDGVGRGTAYSDYGSLGGYTVTATSPCPGEAPPAGDEPVPQPTADPEPATDRAATVTSAPRIRKASPGRRGSPLTARVRWRPPTSDGGAAVSGYRITAHRLNRAGKVVARLTRKAPASKRARELRLREGRYRFRVVAVN